MLCDACLMLLYESLDTKVRKVFFALQVDDFPTIEALVKESGLSIHRVRDALSFLRGTGLVWGNGCVGLSDSSYRLLELLRHCGQPEPAEALCDNCVLEIGQGLSGGEYTVLAQLSDRLAYSRHDLMVSTHISLTRLRNVLFVLQGAQLIQSGRGRVFRLSPTGGRLERLLKSQIPNPQYPISNIQYPFVERRQSK